MEGNGGRGEGEEQRELEAGERENERKWESENGGGSHSSNYLFGKEMERKRPRQEAYEGFSYLLIIVGGPHLL